MAIAGNTAIHHRLNKRVVKERSRKTRIT